MDGGNTNTNTSSDTGNSTTNNDWVAKELEKARAEFKNSTGDVHIEASYKIGALKMVRWPLATLNRTLTSNKVKEDKARKEYKEIERVLHSKFINVKSVSDAARKSLINSTDAAWSKYIELYEKENKLNITSKGMEDFKSWLLKKRKDAGKRLADAKAGRRKCELAKDYLAKHGQPTAKVTKNEVVNDTNGGGSDGVGVGSGASDGNTDGTGVGGAGAGGGTGPAANGTPAYTEGDPYKDKDGNMVTPLKDANGNVVGYKFKDKEGKDQVLMNDDIKKTKVSLDDVKKALEDGDIKKALELLLQALLGKQQLDMQKAQTGNTADGNAGAGTGTTGATPTPEITSKDYIDERTGVKFTVTKQGDNIQSISQTAQGNIEAFTAEHFAKASIEPKDVEAHLQKGEFDKADELLAKVAAANGKLAARVDVNGNDVVLMDCYGKAFTLNKKKLEEFGMSGKKAEGTLKRLRASIETSKKLQKGDANMALAQVVAGYLPKEKPTVPTPPSNGWTYKKSATRMIDGQEVSITVQKDGQTMKLQPSDFASAYGCSKEEGRQIMKSFARSLRKGNTNLNAELDFVATNMNKEAHDKRRKWARIGYIAGGVALAAGGYFAGRAIFKGHGSSDGDSSDSTETNSAEAKSTEILAAAKTTNSNGETPVTPATPASPYTGTTWLDRNKGRGY